MERMTIKDGNGNYTVAAALAMEDGGAVRGDAIDRLGAFEDAVEVVERQLADAAAKLDALKAKGRIRSAQGQQLLAQKLAYSSTLTLMGVRDDLFAAPTRLKRGDGARRRPGRFERRGALSAGLQGRPLSIRCGNDQNETITLRGLRYTGPVHRKSDGTALTKMRARIGFAFREGSHRLKGSCGTRSLLSLPSRRVERGAQRGASRGADVQ